MAGVRQGRLTEEDKRAGTQQDSPTAIRIDTDVFATLTDQRRPAGDERPRIAEWFDCWRS